MTELAKILISIFTPIFTALVGVIVKLIKDYYTEKKKNKQLVELINYSMGAVDTILDESVKMQPELRATLKKASRKYHKLDIVKVPKEEE